MEDLLKQILSELKEIKADQQSMKSQLNVNTEIIKAIRDRQEETDVKVEALAMDVHKLHGELTSVKEAVSEIQQTMATKDDLTYFDKKTAEHDRELFKIKHRS